MRHRFVIPAAIFAAVSVSLMGQSSPAKSKTYTPPKTPWGDPDIQGNWPAQFNIPRERPANLKDTVLSDEEVAQRDMMLDALQGARDLEAQGRNTTVVR